MIDLFYPILPEIIYIQVDLNNGDMSAGDLIKLTNGMVVKAI